MPVRRQSGSRLPVKNQRLVDTAMNTVKNLLVANRANVANAIEATGYPVTIYNRLIHGRRCTCSFQSKRLLDESGNLSESSMALVLGKSNGVVDYAADTGYEKTLSENGIHVYADDVTTSEIDLTEIPLVRGEGVPGDEDIILDEEEGGLEDYDSRIIMSDSNACGLCFGTGYVGGYDIINGQRIILESTATEELSIGSIDVEASPNTMTLFSQGDVDFQVTVSRAAAFGMAPVLYNNTEHVPYDKYSLAYSLDRLIWLELNEMNSMDLALGIPVWVRVQAASDDELTFTHLELLYGFDNFNKPTKADFPLIDKNVSLTVADSNTETSIIVAGDIVLNRRAVIIDHLPLLSRHWMIVSDHPRRDQFGNLYDVTYQGRVADINELCQLLRPLTLDKEPLV